MLYFSLNKFRSMSCQHNNSRPMTRKAILFVLLVFALVPVPGIPALDPILPGANMYAAKATKFRTFLDVYLPLRAIFLDFYYAVNITQHIKLKLFEPQVSTDASCQASPSNGLVSHWSSQLCLILVIIVLLINSIFFCLLVWICVCRPKRRKQLRRRRGHHKRAWAHRV